MKRRTFIAGLGSAAAWPLAARAQQAAVPVVGWLDGQAPESVRERLPAFRKGLAETGYVEGRNVIVEYHWAENNNDRLSALASDLVRRHVAVIVAATTSSALEHLTRRLNRLWVHMTARIGFNIPTGIKGPVMNGEALFRRFARTCRCCNRSRSNPCASCQVIQHGFEYCWR